MSVGVTPPGQAQNGEKGMQNMVCFTCYFPLLKSALPNGCFLGIKIIVDLLNIFFSQDGWFLRNQFFKIFLRIGFEGCEVWEFPKCKIKHSWFFFLLHSMQRARYVCVCLSFCCKLWQVMRSWGYAYHLLWILSLPQIGSFVSVETSLHSHVLQAYNYDQNVSCYRFSSLFQTYEQFLNSCKEH